ncbi:hypothetical protein KY363_00795 [Candidatus Woesearchaeota archaeon]|nr:hypothetical protein [Candidatus Woesearchaeota archaeon]
MNRKVLEGIVGAMRAEIERGMSGLRMPHKRDVVPQYIAYCLTTTESALVEADLGCVRSSHDLDSVLDIEVRVGKDGDINSGHCRDVRDFYPSPDADGLRVSLWRFTDDVFKEAFKDYLRRKERRLETHTGMKDEPLNFHSTGPIRYHGKRLGSGLVIPDWEVLARECSRSFLSDARISSSSFEIGATLSTRILVNSEGSEIVTHDRFYNIDLNASSVSRAGGRRKDESVIQVGRQFYVSAPEDLPSKESILGSAAELVSEMDALLAAPVQKPCDSPVVCDPEFSAQLLYTIFSEVLAVRCSHLEYLEDRGVKKGDRLMPDFMSVADIPSRRYFTQPDGSRVSLNGNSRYDAQGVPASTVHLVRAGHVAGFPCTREYLAGLELPNGHARFEDDRAVPTLTNVFVRTSEPVADDGLVRRLLAECDEKGLDYGMFLQGALGSEFDLEENCYIVTPRLAYRVWAKDAVDEDTGKRFRRGDLQLVSDVQAVGNPKLTLSYLALAGSDLTASVPSEIERKFFQESSGYYQGPDCSIVCPSLYFSRMELKREQYMKLRPPLMPHPLDSRKGGGK